MKKNKNIAKQFYAYLEDRYTAKDLKQLLDSFDTETPDEYLHESVRAELENPQTANEGIKPLVDRVEQRLLQSLKNEPITERKPENWMVSCGG